MLYGRAKRDNIQLRVRDRHQRGVRALLLGLLCVQFGFSPQVERGRHVGVSVRGADRSRGANRQPQLSELHTAESGLRHHDNGAG